jgi:transposase-like protein
MARRRNSDETRSFWRMAIQMQHESGLPVGEFCRREGLHPTSFYAWRRRLEQAADDNGASEVAMVDRSVSSAQSSLVPVHVIDDQVADNSRPHGIVEVVTPDGFVLRVPDDATIDNVRRVLQLMHEVA